MSGLTPDRPGGRLAGAAAGYAVGSRIAGYRLEEQIGRGGMAVVFRALDERLDRQVALKILAPALAADEAFRRRFIRESRAAAAVDDPHIIPVFEAGEADGVLFIAMRYVRGGDVRSLVTQVGPLPPVRAAALISPVASALDAAHAAHLVHRDVKPGNMLIDSRPGRPDHVYLSDFGLSKASLSAGGITGTGLFLGTPNYCPPEQINGRLLDGRADQYALACSAYEILTGKPPFERDDGMAMMYAQMFEPPPALTSRRPDVPAAADAVLHRALAKTPEERYDSCRDFADALRGAMRLPSYDTDPGGPPPGPRPVIDVTRPKHTPVSPVSPVSPAPEFAVPRAAVPGAGVPGAGAAPMPPPSPAIAMAETEMPAPGPPQVAPAAAQALGFLPTAQAAGPPGAPAPPPAYPVRPAAPESPPRAAPPWAYPTPQGGGGAQAGQLGQTGQAARAGAEMTPAVLAFAAAAVVLAACFLPFARTGAASVSVFNRGAGNSVVWFGLEPLAVFFSAIAGGIALAVAGRSRIARLAEGALLAVGVEAVLLFAQYQFFKAGSGTQHGVAGLVGILGGLLLVAAAVKALRAAVPGESAASPLMPGHPSGPLPQAPAAARSARHVAAVLLAIGGAACILAGCLLPWYTIQSTTYTFFSQGPGVSVLWTVEEPVTVTLIALACGVALLAARRSRARDAIAMALAGFGLLVFLLFAGYQFVSVGSGAHHGPGPLTGMLGGLLLLAAAAAGYQRLSTGPPGASGR